ncbi:MAG: MmcQ/YjbR family DNA-binding protein [Ferruginibacter sp.]
MVNIETFRRLALSFPGVTEEPHFHLRSFRFKKKIFATYWEKEKRAMLKLPLAEQSVYCTLDSEIFFPVPGSWGAKGATFVDLKKVKAGLFKEAITIAYENLQTKK